jgi:glycosyltransferase involved in cell wall biosynthesis
MKILHINSYYSGSKFYKNLYDYQVNNGLDISVFVPVPSVVENDKAFGPYTTISKNHNKYDRFVFQLKQNKIYRDIIDSYDVKKFSIIHAHSLFTNGYIAMKLKKNFRIPYIVAVRNTDVNLFFKRMFHLRWIGLKILENADRVVFLSESYKKEVLEKYVSAGKKAEINGKISVIPNGIDDFWFENIGDEKEELQSSNLKLLQVGDIDKNKNIETTVEAIKLLIKKGYKVKLDVVGKIKDQTVFDKIKDLEFVNYLGTTTKEELLEIYRNNDIFILPSINETFGLVYAEAMSQGLPVIYSKGQGFDKQFEDGEVGYSVLHDDEDDIANNIINILNGYKRVSKSCIHNSKKFKWSGISKIYKDIYDQCTI